MKAGVFAVRGEKGNFKGRVFGGFNRHDVIDYIETLAAERNSLSRDNERLKGQIEALEERLEAASAAPEEPASPEPDQEEARRELRRAVEEARRALRDAISEYDAVCADIKVNAAQADHELKLISTKLTGLQSSLGTAGERLEAISAELEGLEHDAGEGGADIEIENEENGDERRDGE